MKKLLSKLLFFPAIWFFFWAIYPLATSPYLLQGFDLLFYLMLSLFNWILFVVSLMAAVVCEMMIANPNLRRALTHIERGKSRQGVAQKPEGEKEKKLPLY
jgi:hypothetical protein